MVKTPGRRFYRSHIGSLVNELSLATGSCLLLKLAVMSCKWQTNLRATGLYFRTFDHGLYLLSPGVSPRSEMHRAVGPGSDKGHWASGKRLSQVQELPPGNSEHGFVPPPGRVEGFSDPLNPRRWKAMVPVAAPTSRCQETKQVKQFLQVMGTLSCSIQVRRRNMPCSSINVRSVVWGPVLPDHLRRGSGRHP